MSQEIDFLVMQRVFRRFVSQPTAESEQAGYGASKTMLWRLSRLANSSMLT
jgi:hypothetical protein